MTPPKRLKMAAEFVLNASLRRSFEDEALDEDFIESLLEEAQKEGIPLDVATLEFSFRKNLEKMANRLSSRPLELSHLRTLENALGLLGALPFQVNLWKIQNACYEIKQSTYPDYQRKAQQGNEKAAEWVNLFAALSEKLSVRVEE